MQRGKRQSHQFEERRVVHLFRHVVDIAGRELEALAQHFLDFRIGAGPELETNDRLITALPHLLQDLLANSDRVVVFELDVGVAGDPDDRHPLDLHAAVELVDVAADDFVERDEKLLAGFESGAERRPTASTRSGPSAGHTWNRRARDREAGRPATSRGSTGTGKDVQDRRPVG